MNLKGYKSNSIYKFNLTFYKKLISILHIKLVSMDIKEHILIVLL